MQRMTKKQKEWFNQASHEEKLSFLANAKEAECAQFLNSETKNISYAPFIRGVQIDESYESAKEAVDRGNDLIAGYRANPNLVHLDEVALGIDGANIEVAALLDEQTLRFDRVIYLGGCIHQDSWPDDLRNFIDEDFGEWALKTLQEDLPFMKDVLQYLEDDDTEGARETFQEQVYRNSAFGFLVNVAQPVFKYYDEGSASFSWGYTSGAWFYGESMKDIADKAAAWGAANIEEAKKETAKNSTSKKKKASA